MLRMAHVFLAALAVAALTISPPAGARMTGGSPTVAQTSRVDLELVLAVDISWSMDPEEQQLQREGYVAAFRDPEVQKAILSGAHRRIAVTYMEWAGPHAQRLVVPWTEIASRADAERFADVLAAQPISRDRMTSISTALKFAGSLLAQRPKGDARQVIDVSGDGPNNAGVPVVIARDELVAAGVVINGLPIMVRPTSTSMFDIANLLEYYEQCVIGGPGSFAVPIHERSEFLAATRKKLLLEIAGLPPAIHHAQALRPGAQPIDCMIGERLWQRYMDR
jgi:hypothetical protein